MNKPTITVSIIGHNEASDLERCFNSVSWAHEIIYVDCESKDNSIEIAKKFTNKIYQKKNELNLNINKNFGFSKATSEWILYVDPDEEIPKEMSDWILNEINNPNAAAYTFKRKNINIGKWLKYGDQYPDRQLRLFLKEKAIFAEKGVHERLSIDGKTLNTDLFFFHYAYKSFSTYISKNQFYSDAEANFLFSANVKPGFGPFVKYMIYKPLNRFIKRYFFKLGFLDGMRGLGAAFFDALNFPLRYLKLWEKYQKL
jgi:glycosyltransferase involved in cell wall biosynthesis